MAHQEYTKHFSDIIVHITNKAVLHRTRQQRQLLETIRRQLLYLEHILRNSLMLKKNIIERKIKESKLEAGKE